MKILLISAGLAPKRKGGVPLYVADLKNELIRRGYDVIYLDTNCQDASRKTRITQTATSPIEYSFFNSGSRPPWDVMPLPLSDVHASKESKKCILEFVGTLKPDIIHLHETLCFPLELVSLLRAHGYKVIFTAQDYFTICPIIQLFKHDKQLCTLQTQELECHRCVRQWPDTRLPSSADWARRIVSRRSFAGRVLRLLLRLLGWAPIRLVAALNFRSAAYRARRLEAVTHLRSFNLLLCMSKLHYSLMISAIGDSQICRQIYLSVSSYADKQPSVQLTQTARDGIIRFVALNINQVVKGSEILLREFQSLHEDKKNTELHLFGDTEDTHLPGVVRHGPYKSSELDAILSPMDVGIVPSIWPESYAYVGPEMLTRGIPLIVSTAGAMREYVIPNVNGLHFDPAVPGQLKAAMASLASDSELLKKLKFNAPKSEHGIKRFADHINEMEAIYVEVDSLPNASSLSCA